MKRPKARKREAAIQLFKKLLLGHFLSLIVEVEKEETMLSDRFKAAQMTRDRRREFWSKRHEFESL